MSGEHKKLLAYFSDMRYNGSTRQIEAGRKVVTHPTSLCRRIGLPHNSFCYASPHYNENSAVYQGRFLGVCVVNRGVGFCNPAPLSFALAEMPIGGPGNPPPRAETAGESPKI